MSRSKIEVHESMMRLLTEKLTQARLDFALAKESRDSDTKSSAGDKYETGREMMQREMDKLSASIDTYQKQLVSMQAIPATKPQNRVGIGSLIETNFETYYLSIGLGAIPYGTEIVYAISPESPLGELLKGKREGDSLELRGRKITINHLS
ncbi:MAG: hypothetical protein AABZ56_01980 [Bacteroidota bacterium]